MELIHVWGATVAVQVVGAWATQPARNVAAKVGMVAAFVAVSVSALTMDAPGADFAKLVIVVTGLAWAVLTAKSIQRAK